MHIVKVSSKGPNVLPASVRRRLGLNAGARLELIDEYSAVRLRVIRSVAPTPAADPGAWSPRRAAGALAA